MMDRRPRLVLLAALGASVAAMLLVSFVPSAGATDVAPRSSSTGLVAALVDRLAASAGLPGPTQLVGRLIAARGILGVASDPAPLASAWRAKLPPALIALEQKMRTLHINSERGSVFILLTGVSLRSLFRVAPNKGSRHGRARRRRRGSVHRRGRERRRKRLGAQRALGLLPSSTLDALPLLTADFESSVSPKLEIVRAEFLGAIPLQLRVIGENNYTRNPFVMLFDGGKPWVSESAAERSKEEAKSEGESLPLPQLGGLEGPEPGFHKLVDDLDAARSVSELGRQTVDGQATTEFAARLDPRRVLGKAFSGASKQRRKRLARAEVTLDLYLASNGLPVRTLVDVRLGQVSITAGLDIYATEIPVLVQPPPPAETITEAELKSGGKLLEAESHPLTKREKAEERRFGACMNRRLGTLRRHHRKHLGRRKLTHILHECERRARLPSRPAKRRSHADERGRRPHPIRRGVASRRAGRAAK